MRLMSYFQVSDNAEALGLLEAASGGSGEFVRPADQQVTRGGVAAALRAHICKLWLLSHDRTPHRCREENHVRNIISTFLHLVSIRTNPLQEDCGFQNTDGTIKNNIWFELHVLLLWKQFGNSCYSSQ